MLIIIRLYKSPAEILMGFDVDSCCGMHILKEKRKKKRKQE